MPPSTVYSSSHIVIVLRRSPTRITSPSPSPRRRADGTLPRHQMDLEFEGRHRAERVQIAKVPCVRYLIGWIAKTFDYIDRVNITLPFSVYEGTWTHSPPLVDMHLLDRSCVIIGIVFQIACYVLQHILFSILREASSETYGPRVYLHHINLPTLSYFLCFLLCFFLLCIFITKIPKILSYHIYQISLS